ncbi:hypothetical protein [Aquirufa rosea]|nr:hypothetical protein [Aquirufa rosea]
MMLKTRVKVSSIDNLSDARYCAGMGVDWLGFALDQMPLEKYKEIRNWLSGVEIVAELSGLSIDQIKEILVSYAPDWIEIDSSIPLPHLLEFNIPKMMRVNIDSDNLPALFATAAPYVSYFVLVADSPESLQGMEDQIQTWAAQYPVILGIELPEEDLDEWVEQTSIQGIGLVAGQEDRPGFRDFSDLMSILEKLETE